jgi:hypothetical protein
MSTGAEADALGGVRRIRMPCVERRHQPRNIDETVWRRMMSRGIELGIDRLIRRHARRIAEQK